jgi:hypothetical protein
MHLAVESTAPVRRCGDILPSPRVYASVMLFTGKVCNPFKDPNATSSEDLSQIWKDAQTPHNSNSPTVAKSQPDPFAKFGGHEITDGTQDANRFLIVKPASNYPPSCGK